MGRGEVGAECVCNSMGSVGQKRAARAGEETAINPEAFKLKEEQPTDSERVGAMCLWR